MGVVGLIYLVAALAGAPEKGLRVNRALRATHSRREANRLIAEGRLLVNGVVATSPDDRLWPGDEVRLDGGEPVPWSEEDIGPHRYVKLHKPPGVECTTDRRVEGNIIDYFESVGGVSEDSARRVYPIGRLDRESTGLILLTSDGSIVNPLLRAEENKAKDYLVTTEPRATDADVRRLAKGVVITTVARRDGGLADVTARTKPCTVERTTTAGGGGGTSGNNDLRFVLGEGRNRQIRRMCAALGLEVTALHRVSFSGVTLRGCEAPGNWARLTEGEEVAIGARKPPRRVRTPEDVARRKAKKLTNKARKRAEKSRFGMR